MRALILSCERVQTHSRVPINDLEGFQGTPVPHRGGTGGASLTTGVGHARPTQQIRQITLLRKCGHAKASILSGGPESSGALLSGRASSRTIPRRSHTTLLTSIQCPTTQMVPPARHASHILRSRARPGHALHPERRAGRVRPQGRALTLLNALWRELRRTTSGHGVRGRNGDGRSGS